MGIKQINSFHLTSAFAEMQGDRTVKKVTRFLGDGVTVVRLTRRIKPHSRSLRDEIALTVGRPNFRERQFLKSEMCAYEGLPYQKVEHYKRKKAKRKKAKSKRARR